MTIHRIIAATLALAGLVWGGVAHAEVYMPPPGVKPMDVTGGTSAATATLNTAKFNAYFTDSTLGTGWRANRLGLFLPGRGWGINGTIDLGAREGLSIESLGHADTRAEIEYASGGVGGGPGRLVWVNRDSQTGPMLRYRGAGWIFRGLNLQGNYHATLLGSPPLSSGGTGLWGDSSHRVDVGLEIQGQQWGIGTGKLHCDSLSIMMCQTAIKCLATPAEDNADQCVIGRLATRGCDTGLLVQNNQTIGFSIGLYEAGNVTTALHFQAGGKLKVGIISQQGNCSTGLKIDGNDTEIASDQMPFTFDHWYVDSSAPTDCKVVEVTSGANLSYPWVQIGFLNISSVRAAASPATPLFDLRRSSRLTINGGMFLYEGMVKVTGGTSLVWPIIRLSNCDFEAGADPREIFSSDSSGKAMLEIHSCCEFYDDASVGANDGEFFPNKHYLWQDGVLTEIAD